jgi:hypothetical protein
MHLFDLDISHFNEAIRLDPIALLRKQQCAAA